MEKLKLIYLPVENLTPYEKNARKHDNEDIDAIVKSIKKFGFRDPIGIWGKKNIIVEGHGRLLAAQRLGMTEVPCIRLDDMTDEERRAYALAHNKIAELSAWDFDKLSDELAELKMDFDFTEFGFLEQTNTIDIDSFFTPGDNEGSRSGMETEKTGRKIQCPHCGEWFEI